MPVNNFRALIRDARESRQNADTPVGTAAIVTYWFPDRDELPRLGQLAYPAQRVDPMTGAEKQAVRAAFDAFAKVSGLSFVEVDDGGAIAPYTVTGSDWGGWATYPRPEGWQSLVIDTSVGPLDGDHFGSEVVLHEIGHAVGLKHPFDDTPKLGRPLDNHNHTLMSYNDRRGIQDLGHLDRDALRFLYGDASDDAGLDVHWNEKAARLEVEGSGDADVVGAFDAEGRIAVRGGNDTVYAGDRDDLVSGNDGADRLFGAAGDDTIEGGRGADEVGGDDGDDRIGGGDGNDTLRGDDGADWLDGDGGNDVLDGGAARDTLGGSDGADDLSGGDGRDVLLGGDGRDSLDGGDDDDRLDGGLGNDTLVGGGGADHASGGDGDDRIFAGHGDNRVLGGAGDDRVTSGTGDDVIFGGAGDDSIDSGLGGDWDGGGGDDTIFGGDGDDFITGAVFSGEAHGGDGDDRISGFNGSIYGGRDDDVIRLDENSNGPVYFAAGDGADTVQGFRTSLHEIVLMGPERSEAELLALLGRTERGEVVIELGGGDRIVLAGVTEPIEHGYELFGHRF